MARLRIWNNVKERMADEQNKGEQKERTKKSVHDDDIAGKVYDGRLMRRLLTYLRPYKLQAILSAFAIIFKAASDVAPPLAYVVPGAWIAAIDRCSSGRPSIDIGMPPSPIAPTEVSPMRRVSIGPPQQPFLPW